MADTTMTDKARNITSVHFNSMHELMDFVPIHKNRNQFEYPKNDTNSSRWYGVGNTSGKDVINHALIGWKQGYQQLESMLKQLDADGNAREELAVVEKRRRKRYKTDQGMELDIHAVYKGNLSRAWTNIKTEVVDRQHKLITLMVDVGGTAMEDVGSSLWRAAVAVKLADALITSGKSVRIVVGSLARSVYDDYRSPGRGFMATTSIVVKQYNEPLTLERLAGMSHLGFHRVFNFMARAAHAEWTCSSGYGGSRDGLGEVRNMPCQMKEEFDQGHTRYVYLERARDMRSAQRSIKQALRSLHMEEE